MSVRGRSGNNKTVIINAGYIIEKDGVVFAEELEIRDSLVCTA
jgi:hypothetical protein